MGSPQHSRDARAGQRRRQWEQPCRVQRDNPAMLSWLCSTSGCREHAVPSQLSCCLGGRPHRRQPGPAAKISPASNSMRRKWQSQQPGETVAEGKGTCPQGRWVDMEYDGLVCQALCVLVPFRYPALACGGVNQSSAGQSPCLSTASIECVEPRLLCH